MKKKSKTKLKIILKSFFILIIFSLAIKVVAVWAPPLLGTVPPENNVAPPVNVGGNTQVKPGGLGVYGLQSFTFGIIDGTFDVGGVSTFNGPVVANSYINANNVVNAASHIFMNPLGTANATTTSYDSGWLMMKGSYWDSSSSSAVEVPYTFVVDAYQPNVNVLRVSDYLGDVIKIGTSNPSGHHYGLAVRGGLEVGANYFELKAHENGAIIEGDVGIGTSSPTEKLDVVGNVKFSGAIMPGGSAGTAGQVLTSAGPGLAPTWGVGGGGSLPSGTSGQTLRYDSTDTLVANSVLYNNGTNIGIGTTSPSSKFTVGNSAGSQNAEVEANGDAYLLLDSTVASGRDWSLISSGTAGIGVGKFSIYDSTAGVSRVAIDSVGNVGVGDTSPLALFTVGTADQFRVNSSGNLVRINNVFYSWPSAQGSANYVLTNNGSGTLTWSAGVPGPQGPDGLQGPIGPQGPAGEGVPPGGATGQVLTKNSNADYDTYWSTVSGGGGGTIGGSGTATYIPKFTSSTDIGNSVMYNDTDGDIGINTTAPGARLGVKGNLNIGTNYSDVTGEGDGAIIEGNVGIGTTSPASKLDVVGDVRFSGALKPNGNAGVDGLVLISKGPGFPPVWEPLVPYTGVNGATLRYSTGATEWVSSTNIFNADANVGIGTITPSQKLDVNGNAKATQFCLGTDCISAWPSGSGDNLGNHIATQTIYGSTAPSGDLLLDSTNNATKGDIILGPTTGSVGVGTLSPTQKLDVNGNAKATQFCLGTDCISAWPSGGGGGWTDGTNVVYTTVTDDKVGIGTTTPASKLSVVDTSASTNAEVEAAGDAYLLLDSTVGSGRDWSLISSGTGGIGIGKFSIFDSTAGISRLAIDSSGKVGIGTTTPDARLHLMAGSPTSGTAPLKFTSSGVGGLLTTTEAGAIEYDGSHLYFTAINGGTRYQLDQQSTGGSTALSSLTPATVDHSIDNDDFTQTWRWDGTTSLNNGQGMVFTSTVTNSGVTEDLVTMSMGGTGATATATSLRVTNTKSGSTNTNKGIHVDVTSGLNNYALIVQGGDTGLGTTSPDSKLDLAGAFTVQEMSAPSLSLTNQGRIYFDATLNKFRVSENGGAYVNLVGSGGGITSLNALTGTTQTFATGTAGTNFGISSVGTVHTFNIPDASVANRGLLTSANWTTFNNKAPAANPVFTGIVTLPSSTNPGVGLAGEIAIDTNMWATSRGAPVVWDGTSTTALVNVLASDVPTDGQVPTWNTGGTITWESAGGGGGGGWTDGTNGVFATSSGDRVGIGATDSSSHLSNKFNVIQESGDTNPLLAQIGTYGFALKNNAAVTGLTMGLDSNYAYLQSWNGKILNINSQGNNTIINPNSAYVGVGLTSPTSLFQAGVHSGYKGPGTVSISSSTAVVTGTGTNFTEMFNVGDYINVNGLGQKLITIISSNTQLTMTSGYGSSGSSLPYTHGANSDGVRFSVLANGSVGVGTGTPNNKAILDLSSTTKAFLPPRMTTTQRNVISPAVAGMVIYNTTTNKLNVYNGTAWEAITSS